MEAEETNLEWLSAAVERFEGPLTRYAASLTGDAEGARDIVQDTFVRLCQQQQSRVKGCLAKWLFLVCRRRALDVWRKERRIVELAPGELENEADSRATPEASALQTEAVTEVLRLVAGLPRNQQEVLRLRFHAGLSYDEISGVTGLSRTNVGFLLHTAITSLRLTMQIQRKEKP